MAFCRLLILGLTVFSHLTLAADFLETDGVAACTNDQQFIINVTDFKIHYERNSPQVTYSVTATSNEQVEALARIQISAYGKTVVDQLVDFCADNVTELCPVKSGQITIEATHDVPSKYTNSINQLAYSIPDLEATVFIQLYNVSDPSQNIGCFNSQVSNGKTAATNGAKWGTLGLAAALLVISVASSASSSSGSTAGGGAHALAGAGAGHAPVVGPGTNIAAGGFQAPGFGDFFAVLQGIAISGMYSLEYPTLYRSFSQNMGWSAAMITWEGMQTSIDTFRGRTGGNITIDNYQVLQDTTLIYENSTLNNPDQLIPSSLLETLSPQATASASSIIVSSASSIASSTDTTSPITSTIWVDPPGSSSVATTTANAARRLLARANGPPTTVSSASATSSAAAATSTAKVARVEVVTGIKAYVEKLNIPDANAFLTLLIWWCIIIGLIVFVMMAIKLYLDIKFGIEYKKDQNYVGKFPGYRERFPMFLFTMIVRVIVLFYGLWVMYAFYQFKIGDSWGTRLLAGLSFGLFTLLLLVLSARIVILSREAMKREGGLENLFQHEPWIRKYGVLYDQFKISFWWFFIPILGATFGRNAFLALGTGNGLIQVVGQLVIEVILCAMMVYYMPFNTKWGNGISIAIQSVRVVSMCLLLTYTKQVNMGQIASTAVGYVLIVIQSLLAISLILLIGLSGVLSFLRYIRNNRAAQGADESRDLFAVGDADDYDAPAYSEMEERRGLTSGMNEKYGHNSSHSTSTSHVSSAPTESDASDDSDLIHVFSNSSGYEDGPDQQPPPRSGLTQEEYVREKESIRLVQGSIRRDSVGSSINGNRMKSTLSDVDSLRDSIMFKDSASGSNSFHFGTPPLEPLSSPSSSSFPAPNTLDVFSRMRKAPSRNSVLLVNEHASVEPQQASFSGDLFDLEPPNIHHSHNKSEGGASSSSSNQSVFTAISQSFMPLPPIPAPLQPSDVPVPRIVTMAPNGQPVDNKANKNDSYQSGGSSAYESIFS